MDEIPSERTCTVCGEVKPLDQFHRQAKGLHGRMANCKACQAERHRQWRQANPDHWRRLTRKGEMNRRRRQRAKVIEALGGCCVRCGFDDVRALHVDHVNSDGAIDRAEFPWQKIMAKALSGDPAYQLLCANCNAIKRYEAGEGVIGDGLLVPEPPIKRTPRAAAPLPESGLKLCRGCGVEKPLAEFGPSKTGKYGVAGQCRVCRAVWERENRLRRKQ